MKIAILSRSEAANIDKNAWKSLAERSQSSNPFYEHWALIPALQHLDKSKEVHVVTAYIDDQLVALFPIQGVVRKWGVRLISLWKHDHCFIADPLCSDVGLMGKIINEILEKMDVSVLKVDDHSQNSFGAFFADHSLRFEVSRGCVSNVHQVVEDLNKLPQRERLENKRIIKRISVNLEAVYTNSLQQPEREWLKLFCDLEHSGWKRIVGGSILSKPEVSDYYSDMVANAIEKNTVQFQGIFTTNEVLSVSFRIIGNDTAYELKTTYDEKFKNYYPGVVLELLNLQDMANTNFKLVDSCANPKVSFVNRLWPARRVICSSLYFRKDSKGNCLKLIYQLKRWYHSRLAEGKLL